MEQKFHRWYYVNIVIYAYLSYNRQVRLDIDEAGLRLMERKSHRRVLSIFQIIISKISQIYRIQP